MFMNQRVHSILALKYRQVKLFTVTTKTFHYSGSRGGTAIYGLYRYLPRAVACSRLSVVGDREKGRAREKMRED